MKTDQITNEKVNKEGEKDNADQTFQILNNIKALLDNNINQGQEKVESVKKVENAQDSTSNEGSGDVTNILSVNNKLAPIFRISTTTTTTTTRATTTTTRTTTTQRTTTTAQPSIFGQIVNGIGSGLGSGIGRLATNALTGAGFAAAASSPLWAPLLIGKKRRRRELMIDEKEAVLEQKIMNFETNVLKKLK